MSKQTQNKTHATEIPVNDFLLTVENEEKRNDAKELIRLMSKISGKKAVMWGPSIIGFDRCHYKYESGREGDMGAIGFSPRKPNLTIYLVDGTSKYSYLLEKLGPHKIGKVCVYIKRLSDIDMKVLEKIIQISYTYAMSHKNDMNRAE